MCRVYGAFAMDAIARCGFGIQVDSQKDKDDPFTKNAKKAIDISLLNPALLISGEKPMTCPKQSQYCC